MVAGRGAGKTFCAVLFIGLSALKYNVGLPHLWAAPTVGDLLDSFWPVWESVWPKELWSYNASKRIITTINGTRIYLRGRLITAGNREPFRGPSWHVVVFDEARQDPNAKAWKTLILGVRGASEKQKTIVTTSTPLLGWYDTMVKKSGDPIVRSTSFDNPTADRHAIARAINDMDERLVRQEVYGESVALSGIPWESADLTMEFPDGNIHPHEYNPDMDYTLAVDIGRQSSWLLIQTIQQRNMYGEIIGKPIDVCVAEYTPNASTTDIIVPRITADYGCPAHVIIGQDGVYTGDTNSDVTAETVMMRSGGWECAITPVTGIQARKAYQYNAANRCLLDSTGHRRFCVSKHLQSHEPNDRGIKEMLEQDQWPDPKKPGYFNKDKRTLGGNALEDTRDAWMYGMSIMHPIRSVKQVGGADTNR